MNEVAELELPKSITKGSETRQIAQSGNTLVAGAVTYAFDGLGRTVAKGDLTITYGPDGQVSSATRGGSRWTYRHDENGQRLVKYADGTPVAAYLEEGYLDTSGLWERFQVGGRTVGLIRDGVFTAIATDPRGTVMAEVDGTARIASPFGERDVHPAMSRAIDYVEKGYDPALGFVRMGVRDYDPEINRFVTADPLFLEDPSKCVENPVECNLYGYARNAPAVYVDPDGRDAIPVVFPDFRIGTPIGRVGGLGHAGIVLVNAKNGETRYFEYGRYDPEKKGWAREINVPDVVMGKDGRPTPMAMERLLSVVSEKAGHGTRVEGAYVKSDSYAKMVGYAESRVAANSDPNRKTYGLMDNNCGTFMKQTLEAGGIDTPVMLDPRPNSYIKELQSDFSRVQRVGVK